MCLQALLIFSTFNRVREESYPSTFLGLSRIEQDSARRYSRFIILLGIQSNATPVSVLSQSSHFQNPLQISFLLLWSIGIQNKLKKSNHADQYVSNMPTALIWLFQNSEVLHERREQNASKRKWTCTGHEGHRRQIPIYKTQL